MTTHTDEHYYVPENSRWPIVGSVGLLFLMVGISMVGFATVATNLRFMLRVAPGPQDWLKEHLKGLVGAGISVYTAFLAFGAVRLMPELALNPGLWAVPLVTGMAIILHHWRRIWRQEAALAARAGGRVSAGR